MQVNAVSKDDGEQRIDLGSHADTCIIGQHALIVHDFNHTVNVLAYDPLKEITNPNFQTVLSAVAYG